MFITANYEAASGVVIGYWRVATLVIRLRRKTAEIGMDGWLDEDAYKSGKMPVTTANFDVNPTDFDTVFPANASEGVQSPVLDFIEAKSGWTGAKAVKVEPADPVDAGGIPAGP